MHGRGQDELLFFFLELAVLDNEPEPDEHNEAYGEESYMDMTVEDGDGQEEVRMDCGGA